MRNFSTEPTVITFDTSTELQALGWAWSGMRDVAPEDDEVIAAHVIALRAASVRHSPSEGYEFSLRDEEADLMISVLQKWVALGPPPKERKVTDPARAKSYKTASRIVAQIAEVTQN